MLFSPKMTAMLAILPVLNIVIRSAIQSIHNLWVIQSNVILKNLTLGFLIQIELELNNWATKISGFHWATAVHTD